MKLTVYEYFPGDNPYWSMYHSLDRITSYQRNISRLSWRENGRMDAKVQRHHCPVFSILRHIVVVAIYPNDLRGLLVEKATHKKVSRSLQTIGICLTGNITNHPQYPHISHYRNCLPRWANLREAVANR